MADCAASMQTQDLLCPQNVTTLYATTRKAGLDFFLDNVQYSVKANYKENDTVVQCVAEESENNHVQIGSKHTFEISRVHSLILQNL